MELNSAILSAETAGWAADVYERIWRKGESPTTTYHEVLCLANNCDATHRIYVRDEFKSLWELVHKEWTESSDGGSAVVIGNPGIGNPSLCINWKLIFFPLGKSLSLKYLLLMALSLKIPTIECHRPDIYTVFDKDGVRTCLVAHTTELQRVLVLCDSNSDLHAPPALFTTESRTYIVHAASPVASRYDSWVKYRQASFIFMNGWSEQEAEQLL